MNAPNRSEFIDRMKNQLDEFDQQIDNIKAKAEQMDAQARQEYESRLHDLREKRREAKRRLDELRAAGDEKWQQLRDEAQHAWTALGNSFNYFKSHFK